MQLGMVLVCVPTHTACPIPHKNKLENGEYNIEELQEEIT